MRHSLEMEVDSYVAETAQMCIPDGDHISSYLQFAEGTLALIRDRWPSEGLDWHRALNARREGTLSVAQWGDVQESIAAFRARLGEPYGMNEVHGDQAAVSFLFALAIESPAVSVHQYRLPQLARAVDEFSREFIEHFGRSGEVLEALKGAFHVAGA